MSEPKFTKGPWRVDVCWPNLYVRHEGMGWPLADVLSESDFSKTPVANVGSGFHPYHMRLANAALIAAAPQMYKKLGEMQKLCLEMAEYWSDNDIKHDYFEDRATEIDLLLKKARGEK